MKLRTSLMALSLLSIGFAQATSVSLVDATPEAGQTIVQYQFLNADKQPAGAIATTILPSQITLPSDASGIRVLTLQNHSLPNRAEMPGGWFNFPSPGCAWTNDSGHAPTIAFTVTDHLISCK